MKKLLITGGNGFIGAYICKKCILDGIDFLALTNRKTDFVYPDRLKEVGLLDKAEMEAVISSYQPDAIIHLAAIASPVHNDLSEIYNINVGGTELLLDTAAKYLPAQTKVVLVSTAGVYGNQPDKYLHEAVSFNPVNHYSYSKMVTEFLSRQYADRLKIQIVRPFNIIGMGQNKNFFIPKMIRSFAKKEAQLYMGNTEAIRDYISVEYCAQVMLELAQDKSTAAPILNICTGVGHSCNQVIQMLAQMTGHTPDIISTTDFVRPNEIWSLVGDKTKLAHFTSGRCASEPLDTILATMLREAVAEIT